MPARIYLTAALGLRHIGLLSVLVCFLWWIVGWVASVHALELTNRSITVSTATPSATAEHFFSFTVVSISALGSIVFEYCENSAVLTHPCTPPAGLDVTAANLASQSGNTGFSIDTINSTANRLVITRTAAAGSFIGSTYRFTNITNPSAAGSTEFVRIKTHASTDGTGAITDNGSVAFATITPVSIGASIPPVINFCVGITVVSDCATALGDSIDLGTLTASQTRFAQSQFAAATNDHNGYSIFALGPTMTSGNNEITSLASPFPSLSGNSQFGFNLRDNSSPNVGDEPSGTGTGTPAADYNIPNFYTYTSGDQIASSNLSTDYNRMTVSYIVNINSSQPVGVYNTTLTYLAVSQF